MSRNRWIFTSACFSIALLLVTTGCQAVATEYQVISTSVVAREPACMPAMTRAPNGDILVAYSTVWEPFPPGEPCTWCDQPTRAEPGLSLACFGNLSLAAASTSVAV